MNDVALKVDNSVLQIDKNMRTLSGLNVRKWESFSEENQTQMFSQFIIKAGGTNSEEAIKKNKKRIEIEERDKREFFATQNKTTNSKKVKGKVKMAGSSYSVEKGGTLKTTRKFIEQKKTLAEIAEERKISERTIQDHLTQIMEKWPETNIEYLRPKKRVVKLVTDAVKVIKNKNNKKDFLDSGGMKLRAIFDFLNEKISYEDIKLALLFIIKK